MVAGRSLEKESEKESMGNYQKLAALPANWSHSVFKENQPEDKAPFKWSGKQPPPAIGAAISVSMNGLGIGVVKGYFVEESWLGLLIELKKPPAWWLKQNANNPDRLAHIFGAEIRE
jgi:hypothetical protein